MNGHIYLIKGNHDDKNMQQSLYQLFEDVVYQARILVDGKTVYLNHFPYLCFSHQDPAHYKDYHIQLFGHVHSGPKSTATDMERLKYCFPTQYDVGVDNNNYAPVSWKQVQEKIDENIAKYLEK